MKTKKKVERHDTIHVCIVSVTDPETGNPVEVEIRKDTTSGLMVGLDGCWLEQLDSDYRRGSNPLSPYDKGVMLVISDDELDVNAKYFDLTKETKMKFKLGQIVATPAAIAFMKENNVDSATFLDRHNKGDWGDLDAEDKRMNDSALVLSNRLFSSYNVGTGKIWVITERDRSVTTLLLPDDY